LLRRFCHGERIERENVRDRGGGRASMRKGELGSTLQASAADGEEVGAPRWVVRVRWRVKW
jgi:hypothetical protein